MTSHDIFFLPFANLLAAPASGFQVAERGGRDVPGPRPQGACFSRAPSHAQVVWANEDHSWNDFQDAVVLVTVKRRVDDALLATLPRLRLVAVAFTGYDHVDLEACRRRHVKVANVPGYSTDGAAGLSGLKGKRWGERLCVFHAFLMPFTSALDVLPVELRRRSSVSASSSPC